MASLASSSSAPAAFTRGSSDIFAYLNEQLAKRILILDGAMGTMIQKRKFTEAIKQYKGAKQWGAAKEFAERALPLARDMVVFDSAANNGARDAVLQALTALQAEAQGHMSVD